MIRNSLITAGDVTPQQLCYLKAYAAVSDDTQDRVLARLLKGAMLKVQRAADRSLLDCEFELVVTDREGNEPISLYQTVNGIESVKSGTGEDLRYSFAGGQVYLFDSADIVVIRYTTKATEGAISELTPQVWQTAAAMYDGEDEKTIHSFLSQR